MSKKEFSQSGDGRLGDNAARENISNGNKSEMRGDRAMDNRVITEDRELSDAQRVEMFRMKLFTEALPNIPEIPGYKSIWLTMTNPYDTIPHRRMLGYTPITSADVPHMIGLEQLTTKGGDYDGLIRCNEMVAFKLPVALYDKYMHAVHHDAPAHENRKLTSNYDSFNSQAMSVGSKLVADDGMESIRADNFQAPEKEGSEGRRLFRTEQGHFKTRFE